MALNIVDDTIGGFLRGMGEDPSTLPLIGPLFHDRSRQDLQRTLQQVAQNYQNYAPAAAQAQQQAMQNQASTFVPANRMLGVMAGPQAQVDFTQLFKPVFPEGHPANLPNAPPPAAPPRPAWQPPAGR